VTINKAAGGITLFSAAGSTTPTNFVVTDSLVAATDTVVLSVHGAANFYEFFVTSVVAGSFNITFFSTGGTTADTPTFNFAVIKGATS
jgi:hypothetical protein